MNRAEKMKRKDGNRSCGGSESLCKDSGFKLWVKAMKFHFSKHKNLGQNGIDQFSIIGQIPTTEASYLKN